MDDRSATAGSEVPKAPHPAASIKRPHIHIKPHRKHLGRTLVYRTPETALCGEVVYIKGCRRQKGITKAQRIQRWISDAYKRGKNDGIEAAHQNIPRFVVADVTRPVIAAFADVEDAHTYRERLERINPLGRYWVADLLESACQAPAHMHADTLMAEAVLRKLGQRVAGLEDTAVKGAA